MFWEYVCKIVIILRERVQWKLFYLIEKSLVNIAKVTALFQLRQLLVPNDESSTMLRLL